MHHICGLVDRGCLKGFDVKNVLAITLVLTVLIVSIAFLTGEGSGKKEIHVASSRPVVAVSTFALYDIVRYVGGDAIEPLMIVPFGVDIHSFEPTPKDFARVNKSALFVYSGAGLEPWAGNLVSTTKTLDVSKHVRLLYPEDDGQVHAGHRHEEHGHEEAADPHYWLDVDNMVTATRVVEKALVELNGDAAPMFRRKAEIYISQLHMLDAHYREVLGSCKQKVIVVNHNAFGYLAERYGFEVRALTGLSPEAMPSAKTMAELTDMVREHGIKTVFFESFVSDRLIKTVAKESGANVDVLTSLANVEAGEAARGVGYKRLMEMNLNKILDAMECR